MNETYMVRVGGCPVGTVTTRGAIVSVEKVDLDHFLITFDTGETAKFRYTQALVVIEA